jgi:small subunit ribosomal protein S18
MAQQRRGGRKRRKVDYIAANHIEYIDYKDVELLKKFISERGKGSLSTNVGEENPKN